MLFDKKYTLVTVCASFLLFSLFIIFYGFPTGLVMNSHGSMVGGDLEDKNELVANSSNIFVGVVLTDIGRKGIPTTGDLEIPNTQFKVRVQNELKGDLDNVVTLNQYGGVVKDKGIRYTLLFNSDPLLEKEEVYLFFTVDADVRDLNGRSHSQGWQQLVAPGYGAVKIESEAHLDELITEYGEIISITESTQ